MNELQQTIYNNLMALVAKDDSFFFVDQILASQVYRIFNYRLASYSQWLEPHALEARGITFLIDDNEQALALVSWPFEKFFNLHENPMTMDLDLSTVVEIQEKMDGSLISTMYVDGGVWLKSKGSLFSEQAQAANRLFNSEEHKHLREWIEHWVMVEDHTVIMEYTAPDNRIVLGYEKPVLTVLAIRDNQTGKYQTLDNIKGWVQKNYFVQNIVNEVEDINAFVESIPAMNNREGYVVRLQNGQRVKIKTEWYMRLHFVKDSINSQRRLFEAVVYETVDDIRAQFYDDPQAIAVIDQMQQKVAEIYHYVFHTVEGFYHDNKHLERKEYAIKGQQELDKMCFGLAMAKYIGREVDYRDTLVKYRKQFGIKDDPQLTEEI